MVKRKKLILAGGVIAVLVAAAVGVVVFLQKDPSQEAADAQAKIAKEGCGSSALGGLEAKYTAVQDARQRAEIAATISQCAGAGFKDMPKAVDWAKKARDDYKNAGNQEKSDQFAAYVTQFEPYLSDPSKQLDNVDPNVEREGDYLQ